MSIVAELRKRCSQGKDEAIIELLAHGQTVRWRRLIAHNVVPSTVRLQDVSALSRHTTREHFILVSGESHA
jgi:hypothetical protein